MGRPKKSVPAHVEPEPEFESQEVPDEEPAAVIEPDDDEPVASSEPDPIPQGAVSQTTRHEPPWMPVTTSRRRPSSTSRRRSEWR